MTLSTITIRAFTTTGNTVTGYAAGQAPTGRFIAPAGFGNCQPRTTVGQCGFRKLVLFGPNFFKIDSSIGKRFNIGERANVEFRMTMFDVLNHTNWRLGGWTGNVNNITAFTGQFRPDVERLGVSGSERIERSGRPHHWTS